MSNWDGTCKKKLRWIYRSKAGAVDDLPAKCPSPSDYGIVGDRSLRSSYWSVHDSIDDAGPKYMGCAQVDVKVSQVKMSCQQSRVSM